MNAPGPPDAGPGPSDTPISSEPAKRSPAVPGRWSTDSASTSAGGADPVVVAGTCNISGEQELSRATTSLCASLMKQFARAANVLAFAGTFGPREQADVLRASSVRRCLPLPPHPASSEAASTATTASTSRPERSIRHLYAQTTAHHTPTGDPRAARRQPEPSHLRRDRRTGAARVSYAGRS